MILHTCVHACSSVAQSCPTLCDPLVCTPLDSSVHGIFQARILEWAAISCSMRSPWPRNWTHVSYVSCVGRRVFFFFFLTTVPPGKPAWSYTGDKIVWNLHTHTHRHTQMRTSKTEEVRIRWVNYINTNVLALILCYSLKNKMFCYPWGKLEKCTKYLSVLFLQMHVILHLSIKFN